MNPMKPKPPGTPKPPDRPKPLALPDRSHQRSTHRFSATRSTGWSLVLDDDFLVDNLADPSCPWRTGFGWGQTHGNELQYYTRYDKNFTTSCAKGGQNHVYQGSSLNLVAKYEPASYEVWHWDSNGQSYSQCEHYDFTSAVLVSKQKFLYGHFEIRCKIPFNGQKLWPAFWLWEGGGSTYREIDIFEFEDPTTPKRLLMNIHIAQALDFGRVHQEGSWSEPINDYGADVILNWLDLTSDFHTYAVQWLPNSVTWLVDGMPVRTLAGHSPPLNMDLIINLAIAPWEAAPSPSDLPASFEIDYIKVYQSTGLEFLWVWGNNGANKIALWMMKPDDRFVVGDFDGDGKSELVAFSTTGWVHLMKWDGTNWQWIWGNNGANKIALWMMKPDDRFMVGDFDGDGRSELLAISSNGWVHLMKWDGANWQWIWGNNGANKIALWNMRSDDKFVVGDFDGDGKSELVAFSTTGWAHLMKWDGADWQYIWGNDGGETIHLWFMKSSDKFFVGSFEGAAAQLLAASVNGWIQLLKFAPLP